MKNFASNTDFCLSKTPYSLVFSIKHDAAFAMRHGSMHSTATHIPHSVNCNYSLCYKYKFSTNKSNYVKANGPKNVCLHKIYCCIFSRFNWINYFSRVHGWKCGTWWPIMGSQQIYSLHANTEHVKDCFWLYGKWTEPTDNFETFIFFLVGWVCL